MVLFLFIISIIWGKCTSLIRTLIVIRHLQVGLTFRRISSRSQFIQIIQFLALAVIGMSICLSALCISDQIEVPSLIGSHVCNWATNGAAVLVLQVLVGFLWSSASLLSAQRILFALVVGLRLHH